MVGGELWAQCAHLKAKEKNKKESERQGLETRRPFEGVYSQLPDRLPLVLIHQHPTASQ